MSCFTALTTSKSNSAIAEIELIGSKTAEVIECVFSGSFSKSKLDPGQLLYGKIVDGDRVVDDVVLAVDDNGCFAINCHGNMLIVSRILELLEKNGAVILDAQDFAGHKAKRFFTDSISIEAQICHPLSKTLKGIEIIFAQCCSKYGLRKWARQQLEDITETAVSDIRDKACEIIANTELAKKIIFGSCVVLTGPANSGKSTLFNILSGRDKAIVSDVEGTTRDWIETVCSIDGYAVKFIDTAGITDASSYDTNSGKENDKSGHKNIDNASQSRAVEMLKSADLAVLVLDGSLDKEQLTEKEKLWQKAAAEQIKVLKVYNKSDIENKSDVCKDNDLQISALENHNIDKFIKKVIAKLGLKDFAAIDEQRACFTDRQTGIISKLSIADSREEVKVLLTELLTGKI